MALKQEKMNFSCFKAIKYQCRVFPTLSLPNILNIPFLIIANKRQNKESVFLFFIIIIIISSRQFT